MSENVKKPSEAASEMRELSDNELEAVTLPEIRSISSGAR